MPEPSSAAADAPCYGVDVGGTKTRVALVAPDGTILEEQRRPTVPERGADGVIADIVASVRGCSHPGASAARGLGIGVAGQVDAASGTVRSAPNLGWRNVPLRAELERALGLPVAVTNDVRAAARGEWMHGAGEGVSDFVVLFVGTGIGGAVVSGGRMLAGCSNTAGELGHTTLVAGGRRCRCPNLGCLEAYAGGWAIGERARDAVRAAPERAAALLRLAGEVEAAVSAATVSAAYWEGDALARELVEETGAYLAAGATGLVNALNPRRLILGGGVIEGIPPLVEMVERGVRARALAVAVEPLQVIRATLGNRAPAVGAAALARAEPETPP